MTWLQWAIAQLVDRGMFEDQAKAVMVLVQADPVNEPMKDRWNDRVDGYPPQMQAVCLVSIKSQALEWIDKNCPKAWFRSMFTAEQSFVPPVAEAATSVDDTAAG